MVDAVGTTVYGYDAAGQLLNEGGLWPNDTVSYTYANRLRNSLSVQAPNASAWTQGYGYDSARRLTSLTSPSGEFDYNYDPDRLQRVDSLVLPGGAYITNTFDSVARLTGTWLMNGGGTNLDSYAYGYNQASQRTNVVRTAGDYVNYTYDNMGELKTANGKEAGGVTNRWQEQFGYAYDAAGNVQNVTNNTLLKTFTVDSLNGLIQIARSGTLTVAGTTTGSATNVTVNTSNAVLYADHTFAALGMVLTSGMYYFTYTAIAKDTYGRVDTNTISIGSGPHPSFSYDLNGNLLGEASAATNNRSFSYDDENQLTSVWVTNTWRSDFVYDGKMRRRIVRQFTWAGSWVQTNEVHYIYDGNLVVQERDANNLPLVTYTRGMDLSGTLQGAGGVGGLLARTANSQLLTSDSFASAFYHADGNGNVTCLIYPNQTIAAKYLYDPFGNMLSMYGSLADANSYRFSSKEWNANSGLYYYLYRLYDPTMQRWLNRDPISELGGQNLYEFILNDPVHLYDRFGYKSACAEYKDSNQLEEGTIGGIVCKDGKKHYCVWTPKNYDPGMDYCVGQHERSHGPDVDCPKTCDGSVSRPDFRNGVDPDKSECAAYKVELSCDMKQKNSSCGKLSGTARQDCYQDFQNRIDFVTKQAQKYCNKEKGSYANP